MQFAKLAAAVAALFAAGSSAHAQFFTPRNDTLSAVKDVSNQSFSQTNYRFTIENDTEEDLFINGLTFVEGSSWDSNLDFGFISDSGFDYNFDETYTFGEAIPAGEFWETETFFSRSGAVDSNVAAGFYDFAINVIGGSDPAASDTLGSLFYTVEVVERIDLTVTGTASPNPVARGELVTTTMSVGNNDLRSFLVETWYTSGFNHGSDSFELVDFLGNWFDAEIAFGEVDARDHTSYLVPMSVAEGDYVGSFGVIGGLYDGDGHSFAALPEPVVTVAGAIPEPSTAALVVGALGFAALRRRRA